MAGQLDEALGFYGQALRLRAQRQQVLASNIANADTPRYQARDFDFSLAMREAMAGTGGNTLDLTQTSPAHFGLGNGLEHMPETQNRVARQNSRDGNTVDLDIERSAFTENALRYETGITLLSAKIKGLVAAIQG